MDWEEELSDEELDALPMSIIVDGRVMTFANADEAEQYLYDNKKAETYVSAFVFFTVILVQQNRRNNCYFFHVQ